MKIDWKQVAQSKGYKSLKASYIDTVRRGNSFDSKEVLYKKFRSIIALAQHHAIRRGLTLIEVLDAWEEKRTYSWQSFYGSSSHGIKKLPSGKPHNVKPQRGITWYRTSRGFSPITKFRKIRNERKVEAESKRILAGKKPRWTPFRKRNQRYMKGL